MVQGLEDIPLDASLALRHARTRLRDEFAGAVGEDSVDAVLSASWANIDAGARIKHHVPLLAERFARGQLWALARMNGHHDGVPAVLFLDTHDGGRAKMAKGFLVTAMGDDVLAFSAGVDPEVDVVPAVVDVMHEVGISLEQSFPKPYTPEMRAAADLIVTFGDGEDVGASDGTPHEHWEAPDPRGRSVDEVRAIRDDIAEQVKALAARLTAASSVAG